MNVGIILAGGTGERIGAGIPKQFIKIKNKPILAYTIELFQNNSNIDAIEVVCHRDWIDYANDLVKEYNFSKVKWLTEGGNTFEQSTINGIYNLKGKISNEDIVVISFGVAPMTTDEEIDDSIHTAQLHGNGISAAPMDLLLCDMDEDGKSTTKYLNRDNIRGFSNPWSFNYGELCNAYKEAEEKGILGKTEPHITSLYLALNKRLWLSKSSRKDIKITFKEDLDTFEAFLLLKEKRKADADTTGTIEQGDTKHD